MTYACRMSHTVNAAGAAVVTARIKPLSSGSPPGPVNLVYLVNYQPEQSIAMTQVQGGLGLRV